MRPGCLMIYVRRLGLVAFLAHFLPLVSVVTSAQTVRPVVVEHKGKARSRFEIVNDTLFPLAVVLEAKSFDISVDGQPTFRPLDSHIHLKLSAMSFRIPPQESYFVFYEAKADKLPAWFVIYCTFAGFPHQSGLNIQVELPHTVYLLQKEPIDKLDVRVSRTDFDVEAKRVLVELENSSSHFGRVIAAEASSKKRKSTTGGFPLLPQSRRRFGIPWEAAEAPENVEIRFKGFTIREKVLAKRE